MKLIKLLALCSIFALSACETTSFGGAQTDSGPRKIPCASVTNAPATYKNQSMQARQQAQAKPAAMC